MAKISTKNIAVAIHEMTKGKTGEELNQSLLHVVAFLDKKRMLAKSNDILYKLEQIINKEEGITEAKITYKDTPDKKILNEIETMLKKRFKSTEVKTTLNEDKNVLGGVKIEVGDEVIDLTLRNKINQLQNYLITN